MLLNFLAPIDTDIELQVAVHEPPRKRAKYIECDDRNFTICNRYNFETILDILRGISNNFNID
jgi:hypothetical protein